MNRKDARRYSYLHQEFSSAIISVSSYGCIPNNILISEDNVRKVLYLNFDDVEVGEHKITEKDAEKIADFVFEVKDEVDILIVHCDAGISRSAGIAAAIMYYLYKNDSPIFNNPRYKPNMTCYYTVLNALITKKNIES